MGSSRHPKGKVLVAGASGVIGRRWLPLLVAAGYEVAGATRDPAKVGLRRDLGARPVVVVADAIDRDGLLAVVWAERPEAVIHHLTDLSRRDVAATTGGGSS